MTSREPSRSQRTGNLRERVTLQERVDGQSESGEPITTYETIQEVFARVEPLKGLEKTTAVQTVAKQLYNVHVRYRTDLSVLDRVQWNGQDLDITAISNPDERHRYLQLDCEAAAP